MPHTTTTETVAIDATPPPGRPQRSGRPRSWSAIAAARPATAQFIIFTALSIGMTVLQLVVMPVAKWIFGMTDLVDVDFRWLETGSMPDGSPFYVFDYAGGALPEGGGGLAYFLAVQFTLALAQFINFFLQRNVTFKSTSDPWRAAAWYLFAYVVITFGAAALQGLYKAPVYQLLITTSGLGSVGEAVADVVTMVINALVSFVVYFPVLKIIFRSSTPGRTV